MKHLLRGAGVIAVAAAMFAPACTGVAVAAVSGEHGLGIRLMDAAVSRKDDPRAHIYIDDFVRPGTTLTRHVQVSDFTDKPMHLRVYPTSSSIGANGWQVADGRSSNELTSWIQVTPATLDLAPQQSATVTVVINVPSSASSGERYATVVADLPAPKSSATVRVASRVGVRVYLDVGKGGEPPSNFRISTLTAERAADGTPEVAATVTNTGDRALDLGGKLWLSGGPGGLRAGPFDVQIPRTLGIGETGDVLVALDKQTPVGPWLSKLTLQSGYVQHTVTGRLTFPTKAGTAAAPVKAHPADIAHNRNVLVPVAIALIVLAALLLLLFWRRRRKEDDDTDGTAPPAVPSPREPLAVERGADVGGSRLS